MANTVGEVVAFCPKCIKAIGEDNPYAWCLECGEPLPPEIKAKIRPLVQREQQAKEKEQAKYNYQRIDDNAQSKQPRAGNPVLNRYLDLYRIARALVGIGETVKVIGIVVGSIIGFVGLLGAGSVGMAGLIVGAVIGALYGGIIFLFGLLISAQGQMLLVQADSAVHTSPFMTNEERAKVMSLSLPPSVG